MLALEKILSRKLLRTLCEHVWFLQNVQLEGRLFLCSKGNSGYKGISARLDSVDDTETLWHVSPLV